MEDQRKTGTRLSETLAAKLNILGIDKQTEELKKRFYLPYGNAPSLENAPKTLHQNFFDAIQRQKEKSEEAQLPEQYITLDKTSESSVLNVENDFEHSSVTSAKKSGTETVSKNTAGSTVPVTKTQSLTHRLRPNQTHSKTVEKTTKKSRSVHSNQQIPQINEHKIEGKITSKNQKLKRSISFQPLVSKEKKMKPNASTPIPQKASQSYVVTNINKIDRRGSIARISLEALSQVKPASPTPKQKIKIKLQPTQKSSKSKDKIDSSNSKQKLAEFSNSTELIANSQQAIPRQETPQRTKKLRKSRNKSKLANSESTTQRSIKNSVRKLSTPKLHGAKTSNSPRPSSTSRLHDLQSTRSSPRSHLSLKLSSSKSSTFTKRPASVLQLQESKLSVSSRKTKSFSKIQDRTPLSKSSPRKVTAIKSEKVKPSSPHQLVVSTKSHQTKLTKKGAKRRSISASQMLDTKSTTKSVRTKLENTKSKIFNANANNVNDIDDKNVSAFSLAKETSSENEKPSTGNEIKKELPLTQIVTISDVSNQKEKPPYTSKYNPRKLVEINVSKFLNQVDDGGNKKAANNSNTASTNMLNEGSESEAMTKYRGLYNMFFMDLVKNEIEEEKAYDSSCRVEPKHIKHKVRFNLQCSEAAAEGQKSERGSLGRTWSGYEYKKNESVGRNMLQFSNSTRQFQKVRKISNSSTASSQFAILSEKSNPIWTTILKSKRWRDFAIQNLSFRQNEETEDEDTENEQTDDSSAYRSELEIGRELYKGSKDSILCSSKSEDWEKPLFLPGKTKTKKSRSGRRRSQVSVEDSPKEVVFPPYTWNSTDDSNSNSTLEPSKSLPCDFVQSEMIEFNDTKNCVTDLTIPNLLLGRYKTNSMVQMKWIHLVDFVTKEVKKECQAKGYEFLQRLSRGNPRVHSLIFLANNINNPDYTPVEVTAIRLPYAYFTSSVACLTGPLNDRQYAHAWVRTLPSHNNLVMLLHRFCTTNWVYHVTQHCAWPSLSQLVDQSYRNVATNESGGLRENVCKILFRQICAGVEHLHQHGVLHGDLNSSNVLVSSTLQVKLSGYGPLCRRMISPLQTIKGYIPLQGDAYSVCTPPELLARKDAWTKNCDIWCMGIILLQMRIGEIPHEVNAAIRLSGSNNPISRLHLPACGYQLSRLIDKILQPCASSRPSVFNICNHPWLSDGTEMTSILSETVKQPGVRRTDGNTFPLPKRLQNKEYASERVVWPQQKSEEDYSTKVAENNEQTDRSCSYIKQDITKLNHQPNIFDRGFCGSRLYENTFLGANRKPSPRNDLPAEESFPNRLQEIEAVSQNSKVDSIYSDSFTSRTDSASYIIENNRDDALTMTSSKKESEIQVSCQLPKLNVVTNKEQVKSKGCDLLKLMENMVLSEQTEVVPV